MNLTKELFGRLKSGEEVYKYTFENNFKTKISVLDYGCVIQSVFTVDKFGAFADIALGYDQLLDYEEDTHSIGAVVGRVANRIGKAQYIDGPFLVKLDKNEGENQLHGGPKGLNKAIWRAEPFEKHNSIGIDFYYRSSDGENGFPGNIDFKVTYLLNNKNQFMIYMSAETDKRTPINLTTHAYYNLTGDFEKSVLDHYVMINALKYLETDEQQIPTGKFNYVIGNPVNFSRGKSIGADIAKTANGFDHSFVINKEPGKFVITSKAIDPVSGRILEIVTDQPTLQFYTSNNFDGSKADKYGRKFQKHAAFCMEPQGFTDAPNHSNFASIFVNPGDKYSSHTQISFQVKYD
ncbi:MAG: galactose mutarotase [Bacteroidales bacterium]|nr:galactose mutarotase [Bacteroidales bacterium]